MKQSTKQTIGAWMIVGVFVLIGVAIGYVIGNDPSLDELEERIQTLQADSDTLQTQCIEELERVQRVLEREVNLFLEAEPTNGK